MTARPAPATLSEAQRERRAEAAARLVDAVVIARNEERHIAACLESVLAALAPWQDARVLLVDSGSEDATLARARAYPVEIYRYVGPPYTAAAGRRVGFAHSDARYVLFVDGDCTVSSTWVARALALLEASADAALAWGPRREIYEGEAAVPERVLPQEQPGGNTLYRAAALRRAGGFNPWLVAEEEGELLGRVRAAGFRTLRLPEVMITHHTEPKDAPANFLTRHRRGFSRGCGEVLRLALGQGLFGYHARRFNRYLATLAYVGAGPALAAAGLGLGLPALPLVWAAAGAAGFALLWAKRGSLREALYIVADWGFVALAMPRHFLKRPRTPSAFAPAVERIQ